MVEVVALMALLALTAAPHLSKDEKRDWYGASRRGCKFGSRAGDVLVLVRAPASSGGSTAGGSTTRAHGRRTSSLAERLASHIPMNSTTTDDDPQTAIAFSLVPIVKAHLKNTTIETLFEDDDVDVVEAE